MEDSYETGVEVRLDPAQHGSGEMMIWPLMFVDVEKPHFTGVSLLVIDVALLPAGMGVVLLLGAVDFGG